MRLSPTPRSLVAFAALALTVVACNSSTTTTTPVVVTGPTGVPVNTSFQQGWVTPLRLPGTPSTIPALTVSSSGFTNNGPLPASAPFTGCTAAGVTTSNVSPQLSWTAGPSGTQSYMVEMFDPIAPTGAGFFHWTAFNIPAATTSLPAGYGTTTPGGGVIFGYTDYGASGYGGPCPPVGDGTHLYYIVVSALNVPTISGATAASTGAFLNFTTRGAIVAQGVLVGTYSR
jgi:Raf kinase inhibitor-like YbhB/YbcL family protein